MKKTFFIFSILLSSVLCSQEFKFEDVVKVDSTVTKLELFNRARTWVMQTYNSEKEVLSIQDKDSGELAGTGIMNYEASGMYMGVWCVSGEISYKFSIYMKDGRYKYFFHDFVHRGSYYQNTPPISYGLLTNSSEAPNPSRMRPNTKAWNDIKKKATNHINDLIISLKEAMNKKYAGSDSW